MRNQTQPKEFQAGGSSFTVIPYDVDYGMELLEDILVLLGEPLAHLISKLQPLLKEGGKVTAESLMAMDLQVTDEQISAVMMPLMKRLGGGELNKLFKRILVGVQEKGSADPVSATYSNRFVGDYGTLFRVVVLTAGAQYASFLPALGGLAGSVAPRNQAK